MNWFSISEAEVEGGGGQDPLIGRTTRGYGGQNTYIEQTKLHGLSWDKPDNGNSKFITYLEYNAIHRGIHTIYGVIPDFLHSTKKSQLIFQFVIKYTKP